MMERYQIRIKGIVQGVGFRPFVYQLAKRHGLVGWVSNTSQGVLIEAEGEKKALTAFVQALSREAPPQAIVESVDWESHPPAGFSDFTIRESIKKEGQFVLISPDIATCAECLKELFDPADRRYRYPFINCTNCGPRFTIIEEIPYDRASTTMKNFTMCPQCQAEYDNPMDRRFHAQPNACPRCGPTLILQAPDGYMFTADPIKTVVHLLKKGHILAIKGLGGFHLACDATNDRAVMALRARKHRYARPLALMFPDLETIKKHCRVSSAEAEVLCSLKRPIVLLKDRGTGVISSQVTPGQRYQGAMLPYTPLHHLLLEESKMILIMTSGNISEEPIATDNLEALKRLEGIADYFLLHDRDIYARYDDSVVRAIDGREVLVRRSRGYAPYPLPLPFSSIETLACGAELKNTFCLTKENYAFLSQHIGDLENWETFQHFESTLKLYQRLFRIKPSLVAYDLHPDYLSTKYALNLEGVQKIGIQHHHAHVVSCMMENGLKDRVIGVACDGTGYGIDGTIWGCEFLLADWRDFKRRGHLLNIPMPGGALAIQWPYRMALSYLYWLFPDRFEALRQEFFGKTDPEEARLIRLQIDKNLNSPLTSSCGRLFDVASALLGVRLVSEYEGQAACELEMVADEKTEESYLFEIKEDEDGVVVDPTLIISAIMDEVRKGRNRDLIAGAFHNTVAEFITETCLRLRRDSRIDRVVLSGGVFQNVLLVTKLKQRLEKEDFQVFTHRLVPTNDGGISLGQAVVANAKLGIAR